MADNFYEILGLRADCTQEEIKIAWVKKVKENHPDQTLKMSQEIQEFAKRQTQEINYAYSILKDPKKRKRYDDEQLKSHQSSDQKSQSDDSSENSWQRDQKEAKGDEYEGSYESEKKECQPRDSKKSDSQNKKNQNNEKDQKPKAKTVLSTLKLLVKWIGFGFIVLFVIGLFMGAGTVLFYDTEQDSTAKIDAIIEQKTLEAEQRGLNTPETKSASEANYSTLYLEFPGTFTTNLINSKNFLQLGIGVSTQYDDSVGRNISTHQLTLRSVILDTMSEFSEFEIQGKIGREKLATALKKRINDKLVELSGSGGVQEVFFTSFILTN